MVKKVLWLDETCTNRDALLDEIEKAQVDECYTELFARNILIDRVIAAALLGALDTNRSGYCQNRRWSRVVLSHVRGKVDWIIKGLLMMDNVERLSLSGCFQTCILDMIGEGLTRTSCLKELSLFPSTLTQQSASTITKGFNGNTSLEEIILSGLPLDYGFVHCMVTSLQQNSKIRVVKLDGCGLLDHRIAELCDSLCKYPNLTELSMSRNHCRSKGMQGIANLVTLGKLEELSLSSQIIASGERLDISALLDVLRCNPDGSLRVLDLSKNGIDDTDMENLGTALEHNSTLEELVLVRNYITNKGLGSFVKPWLPSTATNLSSKPSSPWKALRRLWLGENLGIGVSGANKILTVVQTNPELIEVRVPTGTRRMALIQEKIQFYTRINKGGKKLLRKAQVHPGLWPIMLERAIKMYQIASSRSAKMEEANFIFHMLHGPALLER